MFIARHASYSMRILYCLGLSSSYRKRYSYDFLYIELFQIICDFDLLLLCGTILAADAQPDLSTIKSRNLVLEFGPGIKTNAQLTYPAIGNGSFPAVLLITGSGAEDMNETAGFIRIDNETGEKVYPPVPFYQIA
jgi:uncharacterized protein